MAQWIDWTISLLPRGSKGEGRAMQFGGLQPAQTEVAKTGIFDDIGYAGGDISNIWLKDFRKRRGLDSDVFMI